MSVATSPDLLCACGHAYRDHDRKAQRGGFAPHVIQICLVAGCPCSGFTQPTETAETKTANAVFTPAKPGESFPWGKTTASLARSFSPYYPGNTSWSWFGEHQS